MSKLEYRESEYFNEEDYYLFQGINYFVSKVKKVKKMILTVEHPQRPQYKATTVKVINIKELR